LPELRFFFEIFLSTGNCLGNLKQFLTQTVDCMAAICNKERLYFHKILFLIGFSDLYLEVLYVLKDKRLVDEIKFVLQDIIYKIYDMRLVAMLNDMF